MTNPFRRGAAASLLTDGEASIWPPRMLSALDNGVKRVDIPKGAGRTRPLGIPTVKDRIMLTFAKLDAMIRRRLRALLRKQEKRPGLGICLNDHRRWPIAFFAKAGLFARHTTWQAARQSR